MSFDQLLARKDYSSWEAKKQTIMEIYRWLEKLPSGIKLPSDIDLNQWKQELEIAIAPFLSASTQTMPVKSSKKSAYEHFCQILSGADQKVKRQKFERLISVLTREQWIAPTDNDGITDSEILAEAQDCNWRLSIMCSTNKGILPRSSWLDKSQRFLAAGFLIIFQRTRLSRRSKPSSRMLLIAVSASRDTNMFRIAAC